MTGGAPPSTGELEDQGRDPASGTAASPSALRAACALLFADEALSAVRHDALNRLTAIGAIGYELRRLSPQEDQAAELHRQRLGDLNRQIGLMTETVSRRLTVLRQGPGVTTTLAPAVGGAVAACARPEAVGVGPVMDAVVRGSTLDLSLLLLLLLDNAVEALGPGGEASGPGLASVSLRCALAPGGKVQIEVSDAGPGLAAEAQDRAFERFFTTKPGHAGLGLAVGRTLAARFGGQLSLDSGRAGGGSSPGARAVLSLPTAGEPEGPGEEEGA